MHCLLNVTLHSRRGVMGFTKKREFFSCHGAWIWVFTAWNFKFHACSPHVRIFHSSPETDDVAKNKRKLSCPDFLTSVNFHTAKLRVNISTLWNILRVNSNYMSWNLTCVFLFFLSPPTAFQTRKKKVPGHVKPNLWIPKRLSFSQNIQAVLIKP